MAFCDNLRQQFDTVFKGNKARMFVFIVTYLSYSGYHAGRKVYSVVKPAMHPDKAETSYDGWAPFNQEDGDTLLGTLDTVYFTFYVIGLALVGKLSLHFSLKTILTYGMFCAGLSLCFFGFAYFWSIHNIVYFGFINALTGLFQASGWPCVVGIMGNWFGRTRRGLIFGIWQTNTAVGNVVGNFIAAGGLEMWQSDFDGNNWAFAAIFPGVYMIAVSFVLMAVLTPSPPAEDSNAFTEISGGEHKGYGSAGDAALLAGGTASDAPESVAIIPRVPRDQAPSASGPPQMPEVDLKLTLWGCLKVDGVIIFAMVLFFAKLVAYALLFWLPQYMKSRGYNSVQAAEISSFFDVGGSIGGITIGYFRDRFKTFNGTVVSAYLFLSIPSLVLFRVVSDSDSATYSSNAFFMAVMGCFVDGPVHMVAGAVSADLGDRTREHVERLKEQQWLAMGVKPEAINEWKAYQALHPPAAHDHHGGVVKGRLRSAESEAIAMTCGVVDSLGSVGSAVQGVLVGALVDFAGSGDQDWDAAYYLLYVCSSLATLFLGKIVYKEFKNRNKEQL